VICEKWKLTEDLEKSAELEMNHLSVEEVAARRTKPRKMRELLFRAGAKAHLRSSI
jgi:U3 small nucleolar RNA-associated protein 14